MTICRRLAVSGLLCALLATGCATTPYPLPTHGETDLTLTLRDGEPQIERGVPNAWVDGFGHYFFSLFPAHPLNWKVDNHDIPVEVGRGSWSTSTRRLCNARCGSPVRAGRRVKRLFRNKEMPAGWRYTIGVLAVAGYDLPERLFAGFPIIGGGDTTTFTNTISIYSGSRPITIHEGGHAKDFAEKENRHWKGAYAGLRAIPIVGIPFTLWQEGVASSDALSWDEATAGSRQSKSAYRTLYPAYGTYIGGSSAFFVAQFPIDWWIQYAVQGGVVVVGHITGQTRALFVEKRAEGLEPSCSPVRATLCARVRRATTKRRTRFRARRRRAAAAEDAVPPPPEDAVPPTPPEDAVPPPPETRCRRRQDAVPPPSGPSEPPW
jgi:hypothetical protein